jgi:hypothetical protein
MLKEDNLPIHLEAGALAQDPSDAGLMPYSEVWRSAVTRAICCGDPSPSALATTREMDFKTCMADEKSDLVVGYSGTY